MKFLILLGLLLGLAIASPRGGSWSRGGPPGRGGPPPWERSSSEEDEDKYEKWSDWEESKCLWPGKQSYSSLPQACRTMPFPEKMPETVKNFITAKKEEFFDHVGAVMKKRGANDACGMCQRKWKCRTRQIKATNDTDEMEMEPGRRHHGRHGRHGHHKMCRVKQTLFVRDAECDAMAPCRLTLEDEACRPPMPKGKGKGKHGGRHGGRGRGGHGKHHGGRHGGGGHHGGPPRGGPPPPWAHGPPPPGSDFGPPPGAASGPPPGAILDKLPPLHLGRGVPYEVEKMELGPDGPADPEGEKNPFGSSEEDDEADEELKDASAELGEQHFMGNRNETHRPPTWHCVRNNAKNACLCCCIPYFPDPKTEKCVDLMKMKDDEDV